MLSGGSGGRGWVTLIRPSDPLQPGAQSVERFKCPVFDSQLLLRLKFSPTRSNGGFHGGSTVQEV